MLSVMRTKPKNLVYIAGWRRSESSGPPTPLYAYGYCQEDVPRPPRQSRAVKNQRARERYRTTVDTEKGIIRHDSSY